MMIQCYSTAKAVLAGGGGEWINHSKNIESEGEERKEKQLDFLLRTDATWQARHVEISNTETLPVTVDLQATLS